MDIEAPYREHGPALLAYLCARLPRVVAEDIHHNVWIAALKHPTLLTGNDLRRWLFRVTKNALLDYVKKASTRRDKSGLNEGDVRHSGTSGFESMDAEDILAALRKCIEGLPEAFREVVRGKLAGESPDAIANRLGINRATVDTRFHRAKEQLAECTGANQL
jgi:RNA polymerase sigma-70 factor (ECF subfamily)